MADISPFAAFQAQGSPPSPPFETARVVGFESSSSATLGARQTSCSTAERQGSLGGLNALFRQNSQQPSPPLGPRLSIQTTRSLRAGTGGRPKRVTRIQEDAISETLGGTDDVLGTAAPSTRAPLTTMARACSGNIDMPSRLSKAFTAPECLPDSLVMAAITAGYAGSHTRSPTATCAAGPHETSPTHVTLIPHRSGSNDSSHGSNSNTNSIAHSGRPPMPVTPAVAPARSGSGGQRHCSASSYRDLFDAQAETAMAQAQVKGLQEALRRKIAELERSQQELLKVSLERDDLKKAASAFASSAFASGGGLGHSSWSSGAPAAPTAALPAPTGMSRLAIARSKSVGQRKAVSAESAGTGDSSTAAPHAAALRLHPQLQHAVPAQRQLPQPAPMRVQAREQERAAMQPRCPQVPVQRQAVAVPPQPWEQHAQQQQQQCQQSLSPNTTMMPAPTMVSAFACQAMAFSFD